MTHILGELEPYLREYGYGALFAILFGESFGLPLPGETVLIAASWLSTRGEFDIWRVLLVGWLAAVTGDSLGYTIGRYAGRPFLMRIVKRFGVKTEDFERVVTAYHKYGGLIVLFGRFVLVLRQFNGIVAGTMKLPWPKFVLLNATGSALWVGTWVLGVAYIGRHVELHVPNVHNASIILVLGVALALVLFWAYKRRRTTRR